MAAYLDLAADLVQRLEGCKLTGYTDTGGKPTNGYGHTGPEVQVGVTISQEIADHNLTVDLATADARLRAVTDPGMFSDLDQHQQAALVSFVFNLGAEPGWTIWQDIDKGNLADVPTQMRRFDHGVVGGQMVEIPGLAARREAEIVFWNTADAETAAAIVTTVDPHAPSSSYTRDIPTPPEPIPPQPLATASLTTKIVGGLTGLGALGSQIHGIVAPHADEAHVFQMAAVAASGLVVASSVLLLMIHGAQEKARLN